MDIVLVVSSAGIQSSEALLAGSSFSQAKATIVGAKMERGGVSGPISPSSSKMAPPLSRVAELEARLGRSRGLSSPLPLICLLCHLTLVRPLLHHRDPPYLLLVLPQIRGRGPLPPRKGQPPLQSPRKALPPLAPTRSFALLGRPALRLIASSLSRFPQQNSLLRVP